MQNFGSVFGQDGGTEQVPSDAFVQEYKSRLHSRKPPDKELVVASGSFRERRGIG